MQLILYYAPNACSLVPYVTLTEAGAPFEVHPLNFRKSQHMTPEYLRLNPKHKVPVLVIDEEPLTENVAIQIWIARHYPTARLLPAGRVGVWRSGGRPNISVAAPFVWRCLIGSTMAPFPHPAHRTGHADFPHPALGQDITPSPTTGRDQAVLGVRAGSTRKGAGVDSSRLCVA